MIKNKKMITITIIAVITVAIVIAITYQSSSETVRTEESMTLKETIAYQKTCGDMQKKVGTDSLYPIYYTAVKNEKDAGDFNAKETSNEIESELIQYRALEWYAEEHGVIISEADVQKRIQELIDMLPRAEEYQEYQAVARELGTTYEEILINDYQTYYFAELSNRIYMQEWEKFTQNEGMTQEAKFQNYWDDFVNSLVKKYQATQDFENVRLILSKCRTLAMKDVSEISQIKKAGL